MYEYTQLSMHAKNNDNSPDDSVVDDAHSQLLDHTLATAPCTTKIICIIYGFMPSCSGRQQ